MELKDVKLNCVYKDLEIEIKELYQKEVEHKKMIWQRNDSWCFCDGKAFNVSKKVYEYHKEKISEQLRKER